jgi:hypothetical protein
MEWRLIKEENLITCADMHGEVWKIRPDGSHEVLAANYNGKLLNGPNDVWINPVTGGMYFTDPMFPRPYWDDTDPRKIGNPSWPPHIRTSCNRQRWSRILPGPWQSFFGSRNHATCMGCGLLAEWSSGNARWKKIIREQMERR